MRALAIFAFSRALAWEKVADRPDEGSSMKLQMLE
jgi:hypothetical protein